MGSHHFHENSEYICCFCCCNRQLGEALLSAPVMTAIGLSQGIVTMLANDFMDFLLSYIVSFGFLIIERMIGPLPSDVFSWVYGVVDSATELFNVLLPSIFGSSNEHMSVKGSNDLLVPDENNETPEPLLGSFALYTCDTLSLLYSPFIMVVIMAFCDEAEITKLYGIKEADMEYYVLFASTIIPSHIIAGIFLHNSLELLHGWKMHEYLEYCKVRFFQREIWWKGFENTLVECIEESLRSVDQLCFSSQYYMLNTIHVNAAIYFVIGIEMMTRADYKPFWRSCHVSNHRDCIYMLYNSKRKNDRDGKALWCMENKTRKTVQLPLLLAGFGAVAMAFEEKIAWTGVLPSTVREAVVEEDGLMAKVLGLVKCA